LTSRAFRQHLPRHFKKAVRKDGRPDRTDIKPIIPVGGIMTGFVIIYGHVVKPPYQIRTENGRTFINNVPVGPGTTEKDIISGQARNLLEEANKMFCERGKNGGYSSSAGEILALFKKSTDTVISAKWDKGGVPPKGILLVHWRGNIRSPSVSFSAAACGTPGFSGKGMKPIADKQRQTPELYSKSLQKNLEDAKVLWFGSDGRNAILPPGTKAELNKIMSDERLGRKELMEKLENLGFNHRAVLEIIRNYEPV
jgi:hypothetical protein